MPLETSITAKADREKRFEQCDIIDPILFADKPTVELQKFQDGLVTLFGPPKIGKSTFGACIPGGYFLNIEEGIRWLKVQSQRISSWASFMNFVETAEKDTRYVDNVSMYIVDAIDVLVARGMAHICKKWEIVDPKDAGWGAVYLEMAQQLDYWLRRLKAIGPGVLCISHQRGRDFEERGVTFERESLDLANTAYKVVSYASDITLHMRNLYDSERKPDESTKARCISTRGDAMEDAGDRTHSLPELIRFNTEAEAVQKILACFEPGAVRKTVKKIVKKVVKKTIKKHTIKKRIEAAGKEVR